MNYGQQDNIATYNCYKTLRPIIINGDLEKIVWKNAIKSELVDLVTGEPAFLKTEVAALWDKEFFYIAFWIEEPNVKASFAKRDSLIYTENDIEIFIAGIDCYYEFQINAFGTIYEVFYIWQDALKKGSRFDTPEFDLFTRNVDILGGFQDSLRFGKHPRGKRWAIMDWDFPGLKRAVKIQGKINDSSSRDDGWTVELAFPWTGMKSLFGESYIPSNNTQLRVNFSRFEALYYNNQKGSISPGWSLNHHGVYDSHIPECFSIVNLIDKII